MPLVDVLATVHCFAGAREVRSPVSDEHGVVVHLELIEEGESLGELVVGDTIELRDEGDGARYVVLARRATFRFVNLRRERTLEAAPAELVPLMRRSRGSGLLSVREYVVREGDRVRMRAHVEAGLVRGDIAPVCLDEVI